MHTVLDPERPVITENAIQQAAESVAERHTRTLAPDWIEFVLDRIDGPLLTAILRKDAGALEPMRVQYVEWLVDIFHDGTRGTRSLVNEVRREL